MKDRERHIRRFIRAPVRFREANGGYAEVKQKLSILDQSAVFRNHSVEIPGSKFKTKYYTNSDQPEILLVSSVHGDEPDTTCFLIDYILQNESNLPPILYVPLASPSATAMKSETNQWGHNLNRSFENSDDPEAKAIKDILSKFKNIRRAYSFHSDEQLDKEFYLYETGEKIAKQFIDRLRRSAAEANIKSFTGVDDPADLNLSHLIYRGYKYTLVKPSAGFLEDYILNNGIARSVFTIETPYNITANQHRHLMDAYFRNLILLKRN